MSHWSAVYNPEQRTAIERAYCELRIRPVTLIRRMAAAGELSAEPGGDPVAPFEIPHSSLMYIGKAAERRKAGKLRHELERKQPRDRAQRLQRELTAVADDEISYMQSLQARKARKPLDWEQIRRAARALRELATVPDELRLPRTPGHPTQDGRSADGATATDSLAGRILAASDASTSPSIRARINVGGESTARELEQQDALEQQPHV
jgi:hypothetical protein